MDANPAFSPLQLIATGGFKDITQYSIELASDAYINGGLSGMLADAVAKKMATVLDTSMLLGVTANPGIPGLINESGYVTRKQTGDAGTVGLGPTNTAELGVIVELTMKKNATPTAFVSNVGVHEAYERIPLNTYGRYFENPSIVQDMDWVTSENSALSYTETDATPPARLAALTAAFTVATGRGSVCSTCIWISRRAYLPNVISIAASLRCSRSAATAFASRTLKPAGAGPAACAGHRPGPGQGP